MQKERQPDWQDTNMALFGSDIEKNIKAAAADGEPQWDDAGLKVGLQIWRIEKFKVKKWPTNKYGKFHRGDSYIILNTFVKNPDVNPDKLAFDVHFWIGAESTQDEYGTAAYKTVELDDKLKGEPVQHREVMENESELFLSYFKSGLTYLEGGIESGFRSAADRVDEHDVTMYQVKGRSGNIQLKQVDVSRSAMNSGDVFILDTLETIYQWNGSDANAAEKNQAKGIVQSMKSERGGKPAVETIDEGSDGMAEGGGMWAHLPGERKFLGIKYADITILTSEKGGKDDDIQALPIVLYRMKENGGFSRVVRCKPGGKPSISKLKPNGIYILDTGFEIFIWVGDKAPKSLKGAAFPYAQKYLKSYKRPAVLPIHQDKEGREGNKIKTFLGPPQEDGCCGACVIA